jgi:hypothetical protein
MRRATLVLAAVVGLLVLAVTATAGDVTRRDSAGDTRSALLTQAERDALDLVSVRAIGEEGLGVVVIATFRGNIQKALGRGHLKRGLVAMILRPRNADLAPAMLATRGTSIRAVLRRTRSTQVGAVRSGRTIMFYVAGGGYSNVGRVEVRSFASLPLSSSRALAAGPPTLSDADFKKIANLKSLDKVVAAADAKQLTCQQLESVNAGILVYISALVKDDLRNGKDPNSDRDLAPLQAFQVAIKTRLDEQCRDLPKTPEANFAWTYFGLTKNEIVVRGFFDELSGRKVLSIRMRVEDRDIDAALCPPELPKLVFNGRNEIQCEGGELAERVESATNLRLSPDPSRSTAVLLSATLDDGSMIGPFTVLTP